jgi:flagellum-specific ATP synthase
VLQSVSRLADEIVPREVLAAALRVRAALAALHDKEDLVSIGAYRAGTDPRLDAALAHRARIEAFLRQPVDESSDLQTADSALASIAEALEATPTIAEEEDAGVEVVDGEAVLETQPAHSAVIADAAIPTLRL